MATPLQAPSALTPEDEGRRDCYAMLARVFYAPPDQALLDTVAGSATGGAGVVAQALDVLAAAAREADVAEEHQRFDDLFIGTGKAPVTLYLSHYLTETGREKILVGLRGELASLGLARKESAREPEDHIAGLCELMRHLVGQGSDEAALARQRDVFDRYLARGFGPLCDAIQSADRPGAFFAGVATFAKAFLSVEAESFAMLE